MILAAETLTNVLVTTGGLVAVAIITVLGQRNTRSKVQDLHNEVRTNHGLRNGEYMELAAAAAGKAALEAKLARATVDALVDEFRAHTEQDRVNFEEIRVLVSGDTSTTE